MLYLCLQVKTLCIKNKLFLINFQYQLEKPESVKWYDIARNESLKNTAQQENSSTAYLKGLKNDLNIWEPNV